MTRSPALNLKLRAESFEQRMKVKMIIEHIIKALLKNKIIYSFKLIYSHGLVSGITSLSMFLLKRPASPLLASWTSQIFGFKKVPLFLSRNMFQFFNNSVYKFQKDVNKKTIIQIKLESFKLPRSMFIRLEISTVLMKLFVVSFKWNLFFEMLW